MTASFVGLIMMTLSSAYLLRRSVIMTRLSSAYHLCRSNYDDTVK